MSSGLPDKGALALDDSCLGISIIPELLIPYIIVERLILLSLRETLYIC